MRQGVLDHHWVTPVTELDSQFGYRGQTSGLGTPEAKTPHRTGLANRKRREATIRRALAESTQPDVLQWLQ